MDMDAALRFILTDFNLPTPDAWNQSARAVEIAVDETETRPDTGVEHREGGTETEDADDDAEVDD